MFFLDVLLVEKNRSNLVLAIYGTLILGFYRGFVQLMLRISLFYIAMSGNSVSIGLSSLKLRPKSSKLVAL